MFTQKKSLNENDLSKDGQIAILLKKNKKLKAENDFLNSELKKQKQIEKTKIFQQKRKNEILKSLNFETNKKIVNKNINNIDFEFDLKRNKIQAFLYAHENKEKIRGNLMIFYKKYLKLLNEL